MPHRLLHSDLGHGGGRRTASPQRPAGPVNDCFAKNAADYFIIDFMVGELRYRHIHQGTENFDITISVLITQVVLNFVAYFRISIVS